MTALEKLFSKDIADRLAYLYVSDAQVFLHYRGCASSEVQWVKDHHERQGTPFHELKSYWRDPAFRGEPSKMAWDEIVEDTLRKPQPWNGHPEFYSFYHQEANVYHVFKSPRAVRVPY